MVTVSKIITPVEYLCIRIEITVEIGVTMKYEHKREDNKWMVFYWSESQTKDRPRNVNEQLGIIEDNL